ncbi:MAG: hypothetical protein VB049_07725 [Candidatus Pelethousia sp.]|nr:hypothetical protein [Candidatus Pelethousia sp.]
MSDLTGSIIVILCVGIVVALVFLLAGKRKQGMERALEEYCRDNGYSYSSVKKPLSVIRRVESASITLISSMASQHLDANTGSDSWKKATQITVHCARETPSFVLGSVPAAGNWASLPDWIKKAAVEKLANESGIQLSVESAQEFPTAGKAAFLLFEQTPGENRDAIQRLTPLLQDWPAQFNLVIHSSPKGIHIYAADCFIQTVALLDKLLRLGKTAGGMG